MTAIANGEIFGPHANALTDAQIETLRGYARAFGVPFEQNLKLPNALVPITIDLASDPSSSTVESVPFKVPRKMKCWGVDLGCKSSAGSAATIDVQRDPTPAGGGFTSILDAAKSVHASANSFTRYAPESGQEIWSFGDEIKIICVATGGLVTGAKAILWVQYL